MFGTLSQWVNTAINLLVLLVVISRWTQKVEHQNASPMTSSKRSEFVTRGEFERFRDQNEHEHDVLTRRIDAMYFNGSHQ